MHSGNLENCNTELLCNHVSGRRETNENETSTVQNDCTVII